MYLEVRLSGDALKGRRTVERRFEAATAAELWRQARALLSDIEPEAYDLEGRGDTAHAEYEAEQRAAKEGAADAEH